MLFVKKAEAEGLKARLLAEADGTESILTKKAAGFRDLIETCGGTAGAQNMLITEQLPNIVHEQVNAISNLKIDKVTVWDGGKNADGKTGTKYWTEVDNRLQAAGVTRAQVQAIWISPTPDSSPRRGGPAPARG